MLRPFDPDRLQRIGLSAALEHSARGLAAADEQALDLLRVSAVHRETVQLHDGHAETAARQVPRLARQLLDAGTMLAVGDWVLVSRDPSGARWVQRRVPPLSHIARRDGDGSRHPVVSNVDLALLVMGLDDDFNLRRLERYLTLVHASGVAPVIVLTKADIAAGDPALRDERLAALQKRISGEVHVRVKRFGRRPEWRTRPKCLSCDQPRRNAVPLHQGQLVRAVVHKSRVALLLVVR